MRNIIRTSWVLAATLLLTACSKEEVQEYSLPGKVYFNHQATQNGSYFYRIDSLTYSFAVKPESQKTDTLKVTTELMGTVANHDRIFRAEVLHDSCTAQEGVDFKLLDGVLKAGEYRAYLPVVVYRTENIKNTEVYATVRFIAADELGPGNADYITFKLRWGDKLIKPANWPYYWGAYNDNKYSFAIQQTNMSDWPMYPRTITVKTPGYFTTTEILNFADQLNESYAVWKRENGPLYNIDGDPNSGEIHYGVGY